MRMLSVMIKEIDREETDNLINLFDFVVGIMQESSLIKIKLSDEQIKIILSWFYLFNFKFVSIKYTD